jgi:phosphoadenosine phosphosulfate reductase
MSTVTDMTSQALDLIAEQLKDAKKPAITSSFQHECVVLTDMVRQIKPEIPVLFLETFHHFPQTLAYRDEMAERYKLNLINLKAPEPKIGLWKESTKACCDVHKVGPLFGALEHYDRWFTALRRDQSASRANLKEVEPFKLPSGNTITKVAPLAAWTVRDVWRYAKDHEIKLNPLYELGYTSIGCEPCTTLPPDPNDPRSGRWQGQKLECGIHIEAK